MTPPHDSLSCRTAEVFESQHDTVALLTQVSTAANVRSWAAWTSEVPNVSLVPHTNAGGMDAKYHPFPWSSIHEVTRSHSFGGPHIVCQHGAGTAVR